MALQVLPELHDSVLHILGEAEMKRIDESLLETDSGYRFWYLTDFIGMEVNDVLALQKSAPFLMPYIPTLVAVVYNKLFEYDCTKRHFMHGPVNYSGDTPRSVDDLTLDSELMQLRQKHLQDYFQALMESEFDSNLVNYVDIIGKIHTRKSGNPMVHVPLVQMMATLGFVGAALMDTLMLIDVNAKDKHDMVVAFTKFIFIQTDFIARYYQCQEDTIDHGDGDGYSVIEYHRTEDE